MKRLGLRTVLTCVLLCGASAFSDALLAFCGFYVAKADTALFNKASSVVLVRDGDRTVLTMSNDFKGDPKEFAVVIPVPTVIQRDEIRVADKAVLDHVDAYSAPRLVEYFDPNPCQPPREIDFSRAVSGNPSGRGGGGAARASALGVKIEAQYSVGEYDILILSASQSNGLETWLRENGYRIPRGAGEVLTSYIRQNMKFFVAKVNLEAQSQLGYTMLRPIQVEFKTPKFMLPIRLGTVNADGPQELFIFALTREGRVETTNYRTVKLPTGQNVPLYVKDRFGDFYKAMFSNMVTREDMRTIFTEYAWDMRSCDPCAAEPLSADELRKLGVFWTPDAGGRPGGRGFQPAPAVFITRLHVRYDREHFPEDLVFQQTADRASFQSRYVLNHEWNGEDTCDSARTYRAGLPRVREQQAQNLAQLTGWNINDIRRTMGIGAPASTR
jgi:hypothetical protein